MAGKGLPPSTYTAGGEHQHRGRIASVPGGDWGADEPEARRAGGGLTNGSRVRGLVLVPSDPVACPLFHPLLQLLTPSMMLARTNGREEISRGDLEEIHGLFHDAKRSAKLLAEQADKYIS